MINWKPICERPERLGDYLAWFKGDFSYLIEKVKYDIKYNQWIFNQTVIDVLYWSELNEPGIL